MSSKLIIFIFLTLNLLNAYGQNSRENEFKQAFTKGMRNEKNAYEKYKKLGLTENKTQIVFNHYRLLVREQAVVDRAYDEIKALGLIDKIINDPSIVKSEMSNIEEFSFQMFESLALKGYRRLDVDDLKIYLRSIGRLYQVMPAKLCKAVIIGEVSGTKQETALVMYMFQKMSNQEIEIFLKNVRKAIFAEVRDYPGNKSISENQRKAAQNAFGEIIRRKIEEHPRSLEISKAASDLDLANDGDACEFGRISIQSMIEMRGLVGEWQARSFIEQIQQ